MKKYIKRFILLVIMLFSAMYINAQNKIHVVSDNIVIEQMSRNIYIYVSNDNDNTLTYKSNSKINCIKVINGVIHDMYYPPKDYQYFIIKDDYNYILCVTYNDEIYYIKDIDLYKMKKIILKFK